MPTTWSVPTLSPAEQATLAETVKRLRTAAGLSMVQLAAELGYRQSSISALESGQMPAPTMRMMTALAGYFGVEIESLVKQPPDPAVSTPNGFIDHWEDVAMLTAPPTRLISARYGANLVMLAPMADTAGPTSRARVVLLNTPTGRRLCTADEADALAGTVEAVEVSRWRQES